MAVAAPEVRAVREASRRLVRELGFLSGTLAGTALPPSAVHALIEIGASGSLTNGDLCERLLLEKSSVSRMIGKLVAAGEVAAKADGSDGRVKPLSLTRKGRATLKSIDAFAEQQVIAALGQIPSQDRRTVRDGLAAYARALAASRTGTRSAPKLVIESGYRPGVIGRAVEMQARSYARLAGFGRFFESKLAAEMAAFARRLEKPCNRLWAARRAGKTVGTIAIDGEDLAEGRAHLRWFIVEEGLRGGGIGWRLLAEAVAFCDGCGFREIELWTFRGLDAARRLYEAAGFALAEESPGQQWGKEVIEQRFVRAAPRQR